MTNAKVHALPGHQYDLVKQFDPAADSELLPSLLDLFGQLAPVIEPLGVNFTVGCVDRELGMPDWDVPVAQPDWHLHKEDTPSWVFIETFAPQSQVRSLREIGGPLLGVCLEEALRQTCPAPATHRVSLFTLEVQAARVCVGESNPAGTKQAGWLHLDSDDGAFTIPQEQRDGVLWVAGPIEPLPNDPPMHVQVSYEGGSLRLRLSVRWSLWTAPGTPGSTALARALECATVLGWENS